MVTVINLSTGREITYVGISPAKAVVCAYEQFTKGNFNTADYDFNQAVVSHSGKTVACGDFCAII